MYASKRTIGRQGLWAGAPIDKNADKKIKHANNANGRGKQYYCQVVRNEKGFVVKTIWHITNTNPTDHALDVFNLKRKKKRLRKSMANQPR
jgi:hypothetical protein